jgi:hypothetical protein
MEKQAAGTRGALVFETNDVDPETRVRSYHW